MPSTLGIDYQCLPSASTPVCMHSILSVSMYKKTMYVLWQVPLGVHLLNENKLDEMAMILEDLHERYLPTKPLQDNWWWSADCSQSQGGSWYANYSWYSLRMFDWHVTCGGGLAWTTYLYEGERITCYTARCLTIIISGLFWVRLLIGLIEITSHKHGMWIHWWPSSENCSIESKLFVEKSH